LSRVLKAAFVTVDQDNRVHLKTELPPHLTEAPASPPETPAKPEPAAIGFSEEDTRQNAQAEIDAILAKARREAQAVYDEILAKAQAEAAEIELTARENGYAEGLANGEKDAELLRLQANQTYADAVKEKEKLIASLEPEMLSLVVGIVQKLVGNAAALSPGVVKNLIAQGLGGASATGDITIHVSTEDYETVLAAREEFLPMTDASAHLEITKDHSLKPSDCIIETAFGNIDCSLDQQWQAIKRDLFLISKNS